MSGLWRPRPVGAFVQIYTITAPRTAGVDVKLPFAISADRDFRLFSLSDNRMKP